MDLVGAESLPLMFGDARPRKKRRGRMVGVQPRMQRRGRRIKFRGSQSLESFLRGRKKLSATSKLKKEESALEEALAEKRAKVRLKKIRAARQELRMAPFKEVAFKARSAAATTAVQTRRGISALRKRLGKPEKLYK